MDTENLRSFLEVATHGSFTVAASRLNLAQSTVSARIRGLEEQLGRRLFVRDRDGVTLTPAGRQFLPHASSITRTWEQSRQDIAVPDGYETLLRLTAPAYLWDRITSPWVEWMRARRPNVALRLEGSFPDSAIDQLAEGLLDICILYLPRPHPGIVYETLAVDQVVLVQHAAQTKPWTENYILMDWGLEFRIEHDRAFAGMVKPAISAGLVFIGLQHVQSQQAAAYLPLSAVSGHIERGEMRRIDNAPVFQRPIYLAYPSNPVSSDVLDVALTGLRTLARTGPKGRVFQKVTVLSAWPARSDRPSHASESAMPARSRPLSAAWPVRRKECGSGSNGRAGPRRVAAPAVRRSGRSCAGSACGTRSPKADWWRWGFRRRDECVPSRSGRVWAPPTKAPRYRGDAVRKRRLPMAQVP